MYIYIYIESIPYNGVSALCTLTKTTKKWGPFFHCSHFAVLCPDLPVPSSQKPWTSTASDGNFGGVSNGGYSQQRTSKIR